MLAGINFSNTDPVKQTAWKYSVTNNEISVNSVPAPLSFFQNCKLYKLKIILMY